MDMIAVRAESPLLRDGKLVVTLDFPYPSANSDSPWAGNWNRPGAHTSELVLRANQDSADIRRKADASNYNVLVAWSKGCEFSRWPEAAIGKHTFRLSGDKTGRMEFGHFR
jgi:hypothetical protein